MNRAEFGDRFNRVMEDMEKMSEAMPNPSKEMRHMQTAMSELAEVARWMGFNLITPEELQAQRAKTKPALRSVK